MWRSLLQFVDDCANDAELFDEVDLFLVIAEQHARDVAVLDDEDILLDACLQRRPQEPLEEGHVLAQFSNFCEFVLEESPNVVRFFVVGLCGGQQDLVSELPVELLFILIESPQLRGLDKAIGDSLVLWINLKETLML